MLLVIKVIAAIVLSFVSAILYRMGGKGAPYNTKYRDFGTPLCALVILGLWGPYPAWWVWIVTFGLMFGVMTTYFKFGGQADVKWYNWLITGFMYGLSAIVIAITKGCWVGFGIRTVLLALAIMFWSEKIDEVNWEEGGRGFMFAATIPLLLI